MTKGDAFILAFLWVISTLMAITWFSGGIVNADLGQFFLGIPCAMASAFTWRLMAICWKKMKERNDED